MIKLKNLLKENLDIKDSGVDGRIYNWKEEMKEGKFDPENPTVHLIGYGTGDYKFLKKYKLDADDLLDVLDAGSSSQRRRYSMAILAAMKGNRRALRALDNLLGFL